MKKYIFFILLISFIYPRRNCLLDAETDVLRRSTRPERQTHAVSDLGYFYIWYDTTGSKAPDLIDINENGVPDYIDEVGIIADSARKVIVEVMRYQHAPFDADSIYDIYVKVYPPKSFGHCLNEGNGISYLEIDNDYSGNNSNYGQTPLKIMQLTVAHEYFHAIQYGYQENHGSGSGSDAYFYEMSSMWIEDLIVPDGNDYLEDSWIDLLLDNPEGDFDNRWPQCSPTVCDGEGYELALFGHYLSSYIDLKLSSDEKQSNIMKLVWEEYGRSYINGNHYDKPLVVIDRILKNEFQSSFIEAWVDFIGRNLYNGIMDNSFYYYADQALINPIQTNPLTLADSVTIELSLNNKSVEIHSYQIDESGLFGFDHLSDDYVGRFSIVSTNTQNNLFWGSDTFGIELKANSNIHFIYSSVNQGSASIDIIYDKSCGILEGVSVWPGDTNADDIVNIYDIDPIAQYWSQNQSGVDICKRSHYSENVYQWSAQPLLDNMLLENNCISHADANGDGKVDIADILAIIINWENETSDSSDSDVEEEICNAEDLSSYFDNYSQIYSSLRGNSNAEIQLRHRLEDLFGFSPIPTSYQIYQNYPNPFNPITSIPYYLSEQADVVLSVFDLMGKQVIKKGAYIMHDGPHEIIINGQNLSTGVYFYQFKINGHEFMPKKMVLLK